MASTYLIRKLGATKWEGPFGPLEDITAAALLFARLSRLAAGASMELELAKRSDEIQPVRVTRDEDGVGYTLIIDVDPIKQWMEADPTMREFFGDRPDDPDDPTDPGQSGII